MWSGLNLSGCDNYLVGDEGQFESMLIQGRVEEGLESCWWWI